MSSSTFHRSRDLFPALLCFLLSLGSASAFPAEPDPPPHLTHEQTLYHLIAERLSLMRDVAAHKWLNGLRVEDAARESVVIEAAVADGLRRGMMEKSSRRFFEVQIEAAKDIQHYWFSQWRRGNEPASAPDLIRIIRPRLLETGTAIVDRAAMVDREPTRSLALFLTVVDLEGLSTERSTELFQALTDITWYDDRLDQIRSTGMLRVGTTGDYAPFSFSDDGKHYEGLDIELAHDLADGLGVRLVLVQTSWPTLLADLQAGAWDLAMSGVSRTAARADVGHLSIAYYTGGKTPVSRCADKAAYSSLAEIDRPGVRVIVNPGGTNEAFVDANIRSAEKVLHADNRSIFEALLNRDGDVMITDRIEVSLQTRRHPELCATMATNLSYQEKGFLMPRDDGLKAFVDRWLTARLDTGRIDDLIDTHLNRAR